MKLRLIRSYSNFINKGQPVPMDSYHQLAKMAGLPNYQAYQLAFIQNSQVIPYSKLKLQRLRTQFQKFQTRTEQLIPSSDQPPKLHKDYDSFKLWPYLLYLLKNLHKRYFTLPQADWIPFRLLRTLIAYFFVAFLMKLIDFSTGLKLKSSNEMVEKMSDRTDQLISLRTSKRQLRRVYDFWQQQMTQTKLKYGLP